MSMRVEELKEADAVHQYLKRFECLVGVRIPLEYVSRGTVYGFFDADGKMVGGYTLITTPPYRGVVFLPDRVRNTHWFFKSVSMNNVLEINGLWLERRALLSASNWHSLWWNLIRTTTRMKRRYVLVWYNRANRHLDRLYGRLRKEIIYQGPSQPNGSETTHAEICVAYTTSVKLYASLAAHWPKLLKIGFAKFRRSLAH